MEDANVESRLVERDLEHVYLGRNGLDLLLDDKVNYVMDLEDHVEKFIPCLDEISGVASQKKILGRLRDLRANPPA